MPMRKQDSRNTFSMLPWYLHQILPAPRITVPGRSPSYSPQQGIEGWRVSCADGTSPQAERCGSAVVAGDVQPLVRPLLVSISDEAGLIFLRVEYGGR